MRKQIFGVLEVRGRHIDQAGQLVEDFEFVLRPQGVDCVRHAFKMGWQVTFGVCVPFHEKKPHSLVS